MRSDGYPRAELTYDAGATTPLPVLLDIPGVERVADPVESGLDAVYFDTESLALATRHITLRRHTGDLDHGWQLRIPDGNDHWQELNVPLGQPDAVPREILANVLAYTRGKDLVPVARLGTRRNSYRLYGAAGEHLADFADDRIHAEAMLLPGTGVEWREWKVLLVHGSNDLLVAAKDTLSTSDVRRSRNGSELARTLGDAFPHEHTADTGKPRKKGPVSDVVTAYLDVHIKELLVHDSGVRAEHPDAVHQMRSATRRLRSALSTYADLYTKDSAHALGAEVKWLARLLGKPRDGEVMRARLLEHVADLPQRFRTESVSEPLERELGTAYNVDYRELMGALESDRYYRLLDRLEQFRDRPPTKGRASKPARRETAKLVNKMAKRLDSAHKSVSRTKVGEARDIALHQVRKDAKRLLHAADSVAEIHGKRARQISIRAHKVQKILGNHHDSVMVRALLDDLATDPALPEDTVSAYRQIRDVEKDIARAAVKKYSKARKKARGLRLNR